MQRSPSITQPTEDEPLDRHGYLFGQHITHSLSPFLHGIIYRHLGLRWSQIRLDSADLSAFLSLTQHPQFYGASVTMPNKIAIIPHLDELTDECRDVGACNTLFLRERDGKRLLCGANTDVIGIRDAFLHNAQGAVDTFHGRPALVIGGGGAARSAIYALRKYLHSTTIYLINRDDAEVRLMMEDCTARGFGKGLLHVSSVRQAELLDAPAAIVACVPDLEPKSPEEKLARSLLTVMLNKETKGAMLEMCYNPTPFTRLKLLAEDVGWQVILGTEAMIWQGLQQDIYWTGRQMEELPIKELQKAVAQEVMKRR